MSRFEVGQKVIVLSYEGKSQRKGRVVGQEFEFNSWVYVPVVFDNASCSEPCNHKKHFLVNIKDSPEENPKLYKMFEEYMNGTTSQLVSYWGIFYAGYEAGKNNKEV